MRKCELCDCKLDEKNNHIIIDKGLTSSDINHMSDKHPQGLIIKVSESIKVEWKVPEQPPHPPAGACCTGYINHVYHLLDRPAHTMTILLATLREDRCTAPLARQELEYYFRLPEALQSCRTSSGNTQSAGRGCFFSAAKRFLCSSMPYAISPS